MNKHEFALYVSNLSDQTYGNSVILSNAAIIHRIQTVLRLERGQTICLFDRNIHIVATLEQINKKNIVASFQVPEKNKELEPSISVLLPLLKKEAFSDALYSCAELGVQRIIIVTTKKMHKNWWQDKNMEHAQKIIVAAAEQSKYFAFPEIVAPQSLEEALERFQASEKIVFDVHGISLFSCMQSLMQKMPNNLLVALGPEGDFLESEKKMLDAAGFIRVALTPTIMRAQQALAVGLGALRSS